MDDEPLDGKDGFASWVRSQWDRADSALLNERRDYWLNLAFLEGEQWVWWHKGQREVYEWPRDKKDDRVRLTANKIQPNLVTLLAKLMKRTLGFEVPATDTDDGSIGGARLAEHLLEAERVDRAWENLRHDELVAAFLGGSAAVIVEWDPNGGERLGEDPDSGETVFEGYACLSPHSITEFTLEPGTRRASDARWMIAAKLMPPVQVQEHYDLAKKPPADAQLGRGILQRKLIQQRGLSANIELTTVLTYYERPNKRQPKGRWAVVVGDEAVVDKPWPFPFKDKLNCYVFRQLKLPKRWTGGTLLNDARPLQVAYNHALSNVQEHVKLAGNARLAVPDTSGIEPDDLTNNVGEVITFDGQGQAPLWLAPPQIPRWIMDQLNRLEEKIDDVMAVHDISRGVAPGDRNSGLALSVLAEKDETPLGLMAHDQSQGWGEIASMVLKCWEQKVTEYRTATVQTDMGMPMVREWTGKQLSGQTRAVVPLDNVLPHSRVALQAWVMNITDRFPSLGAKLAEDPGRLARLLDMPGAGEFTEVLDADVAEAQRENELLFMGIIPGAGDTPAPFLWQDHPKHIAEHNRARKSKRYQYADQAVRDNIDLHLMAHETLAFEQAQASAEQNAILEGGSAIPQADEPPGSMVPGDFAEGDPQQAAMAGQQTSTGPIGGMQ